jgi:hypothetical protein
MGSGLYLLDQATSKIIATLHFVYLIAAVEVQWDSDGVVLKFHFIMISLFVGLLRHGPLLTGFLRHGPVLSAI